LDGLGTREHCIAPLDEIYIGTDCSTDGLLSDAAGVQCEVFAVIDVVGSGRDTVTGCSYDHSREYFSTLEETGSNRFLLLGVWAQRANAAIGNARKKEKKWK